MVSPELLRRFPFFSSFNEAELIIIAMIADQEEIENGTVLFEENQPATTLYVLQEGSVELFFKADGKNQAGSGKEFSVGEINPGEIFAISSFIEPYILNAGARTSQNSKIVKINAEALRAMFENDCQLGYKTMHQITKALMERLTYTRVQLAAAWA
jgi:CRP/FNR family transcriptional regulator, cyclic AMP receptor protein